MRNNLLTVLIVCCVTASSWAAVPVEFWLTNPDRSALFQEQSAGLLFKDSAAPVTTIEIKEATTFQAIEGFGYALTGGSAQMIVRMSPAARSALLNELFGVNGTGIGVSYLRVSVGASDLNDRPFSYDDLPAGQTDPDLKQFDLGPDKQDVIPALKQILSVDPGIKILGSPWSAPAWMKDNHATRGGTLQPQYYDAYARYLVKYIVAMKDEGISIDAITPQNEPLNSGNNPSMVLSATDENKFIRDHLGPAFRAAGLKTKIICFDHNADHPEYPLTILNDPVTKPFVQGSAFHLYGGQIDALDQVHAAHPDKSLYFTEQWIAAPGDLRHDLNFQVGTVLVGSCRHWCRTVLQWNLAADAQWGPHTDDGGCTRCLGALTIEGDRVTRNPAYYIIAHAAKFVRPGSVRIDSNALDDLPNVAFKTPAGRTVLIVLNRKSDSNTFNVHSNGRWMTATLPAGAVGTFVWKSQTEPYEAGVRDSQVNSNHKPNG